MPMTETDQTSTAMSGIDETIGRVEQLFRAVTGRDIPPNNLTYAPIPAERDAVEHVEQQLDRLLGMLGQAAPGVEVVPPWLPPLSVYESDTEIVICMDLPGVGREQVEVTALGNTLTITGQRPAMKQNGIRLCLNESRLGPFRRSLMIPQGLKTGEPNALMRDGVLEIRIAKTEPGRAGGPRAVPVN